MNKKNIILILVGILIISMRFNVTFGHINIDVTNDCVGFLLIIIGVLPMINRNSRFKKSGIVAIVGFIASVIAQVINFIDWQEAAGSMLTISLGITVIFAIYFTYYFINTLSGRMYPARSVQTKEKISMPSCKASVGSSTPTLLFLDLRTHGGD